LIAIPKVSAVSASCKIDSIAVDFVAMAKSGITSIQVGARVPDAKTLQRKLVSLQKISDHYPKLNLTLDKDPEADYEGIKRMNALDWLIQI
jgi:predicted AAA+ superfamily ATPase